MRDDELIGFWKSGLNKYQVSEMYRREYNQRIKIVRYDRRHRYERFMTKYEALAYVERIILEEMRRYE